jgi:MFS family permease
MKSKLVLLVVCCLALASAADSLSSAAPQRSRAEVYALEGLGALPGIAGCGCLAAGIGYIGFAAALSQAFSEDPNPEVGSVAMAAICVAAVSAAALPAAAAYGTAKVGAELGESGSQGMAYGGAYAGAVVGTALALLGGYVAGRTSDLASIPFYVVGGLAVPAGAVVGYNLGTPAKSVGGRLQVPNVALTGVELPDHSVEYGVKVQLAGVRF